MFLHLIEKSWNRKKHTTFLNKSVYQTLIPTLFECIPVKVLKGATKMQIFPDSWFTWIVFREIPWTEKPSVVVTRGIPSLERPWLYIFPWELGWPKKKKYYLTMNTLKTLKFMLQNLKYNYLEICRQPRPLCLVFCK